MGKVLLFNVNMMKAGQIISVGNKLGHEVVSVDKKYFNLSVGTIAGRDFQSKIKEETLKKSGKDIPGELMLMVGFNSGTIDAFLDAYNSSGIEKIKNKAVLNPMNSKLNAYELYEELEEHSRFFTKN